jgi:sucrose-6-phosphate hydrolase SacC (GH32 family)
MRLRAIVGWLVLVPAWLAAPQAAPFPEALVSWAPDPAEPVFRGGGERDWDRKIRERGWILVEDGTYHLFYTGYNDDLSPDRLLGHATSKDGIHWQRDPANPIYRDGWVEDMCVVRHNGRYIMFAEGRDDIAHRLTSDDLIHWTERGPLDIRTKAGEPIAPGPRGTPFVLIEGDRWFLLYERGDRGVWLASSPDGEVWTNVRDDPVLPMGPDRYDSQAVAVNQVVKRDDGFYYALYHANAHRPWRDWTTCIARSRDLIHWEKFAGNPILDDNLSSAILVDDPGGPHLYTMHPEVRRFSPRRPAR